ncbi:FAD-dependent monooxygenase [Actinosynnema sp. NPDC053489]|uniref:FAD-dependent monooxygenase n=1 Tax=Actinosynnema sp. NPDC053489 TaxID=3363916 RepID=UPI0037C6F952
MHDVVIAGAGPVGLFLACELGLGGCSVLVLEREPRPGSRWRAAPLGLRGLSAASVQAFHRRGLADRLVAASGVRDAPSGPPAVGHFAGMALDPAKVDLDALPHRLAGAVPRGLMTSLEAVEAVLAERAAGLGVEIRRGVAVSDVEPGPDGVVVHAGGQRHAARWVVGCDGGRSAVRRAAGFGFVGTQPLFTGYTMLVDVDRPEVLRPGFHPTPDGMYLRMPAEGHLGVVDFDGGAFDRGRQPDRAHLQAVLRRVSGTDVTLTAVHLVSTFTDRAMQATTYRRGRVLLAGDAAHVHSPLGGQGLNTGLGDALNLGWKLAAVVRGRASEALLDTYTGERHPVGADVLDWTRAQSAAMRPDAHGRAVQGVLRDLLGTRDGTTYAYGRVSGASLRHDLGGRHPLVGLTAPDFRLADGTGLADLMRDGRAVLLDFDGLLHGRAVGREELRHVTGPAADDPGPGDRGPDNPGLDNPGLGDRELGDRELGDLGLGAVLVRPDGVVAWAADRDPDRDPDPAALDRAVGRFLRGDGPR